MLNAQYNIYFWLDIGQLDAVFLFRHDTSNRCRHTVIRSLSRVTRLIHPDPASPVIARDEVISSVTARHPKRHGASSGSSRHVTFCLESPPGRSVGLLAFTASPEGRCLTMRPAKTSGSAPIK